jgi:hypothetical protein
MQAVGTVVGVPRNEQPVKFTLSGEIFEIVLNA